MADSHDTLICPACGNDMQKVFIPSKGINIDICTQGCGGIFFDNREFKIFSDNVADFDEIIQATENNEYEAVDETQDRYCPACGAKMVKNYANREQNIQIDECYTFGGKFLDHGEFSRIKGQ